MSYSNSNQLNPQPSVDVGAHSGAHTQPGGAAHVHQAGPTGAAGAAPGPAVGVLTAANGGPSAANANSHHRVQRQVQGHRAGAELVYRPFDTVSVEVFAQIVEGVNVEDLLSLRRVSKSFHAVLDCSKTFGRALWWSKLEAEGFPGRNDPLVIDLGDVLPSPRVLAALLLGQHCFLCGYAPEKFVVDLANYTRLCADESYRKCWTKALRGFRIPRLNVGKVHPLARECTPSFLRSDSGEGLIGAHYPYFDDYPLLGRAFDPINERLLALQPQHDAEVARRQADDPKAEHYETELECFVRERKSEAKRRTDLGRAFLPPLDRWQAAREAERKAAREEEDRARRAAEEARRKAEKARLIAEANARKLKEARRWTSGDTDYRATCMPQACQLYSNAYGPLPRPAQREMLCQDAFLRLGAVDSFYEYVPHKRRLTSRSHWDDNKEALLEELASKELDLKLGVFNKIAAVEPSIAPIGATYSQHPGLDTGADDSVKPLPTRYLLNAIPEATHRLMDREVGKISHHFVCRRCKVHDAYPDILYHICDSAHPRRRLSLLDYQRYPRTTTRLCDVNQLELDPRRVQVVQALLKVAKIADSRKAEEAVDKTSGRWSCGACVADESSSVEGQEVPAALDFFPMVDHLIASHSTEPAEGVEWQLPAVLFEWKKVAAARKQEIELARSRRMDQSA